MITISLLLFFSSLICVYLGIYVIRLNMNAALNRVFLLLCICFAVWGFGYSYVISAPTKETVWFWFKLSSLGWCTFGGISLHFFLTLTNQRSLLKKWWIYVLLYVPGFVLVYKTFTGIVTAHDFVRHSLGWYEVTAANSFWFWMHLGNFSLCVVVGLLLTFIWGRRSEDFRERKQASIIVGTGVIAFVFGVFTNIILPVLHIVELPAIAPIIIMVWLLGMWYAIANYELMILTNEIAMQEIVERVMDLLISINPEAEITSVNQRTLDLIGCTRAELIGALLENIIIEPEAIEQLLSAMQGNLVSVENVSMTYRTCKDEMIPVNVSGSAVKSRLGTIRGLVIVAQDMRQARQLEQATAATRDLLNNAGQGFLSFSSDLLVREGYSSECVSIFQTEIENRSIAELIYPTDPEQQGFIEELLNRILAETDYDRLELYMPLLPEEVLLNQRNVALEYRIIDHHEEAARRLMLIMTDITDKRDLETQMEEEKRILKMVVRVIVNQRDFMDCAAEYRKFFIDDMKQLFASRPFAETIGLILRAVHTFKGNFSQFNMDNLVAKLHELESYLSVNDSCIDSPSDWDKVQNHLLSLNIHLWLEEEMEILSDVLGEQFFNQESMICVDKARLLKIERKVLSNLSVADCNLMLPELRRLRYIPFKELIAAYPEYVEQMAERMDKLINPLQIVGSDVAVDPDHYQEFARALVHVFRNSVAHGIESPQDRIEAGKEDFGNLWCEILAAEDRLLINIGDDGQGIDLAKLAAKAVEDGFNTRETVVDASEADLLALLFNDQFSLTDQVTDYSGRGVGLAAVKEALGAIGGGVEIHTELGIGTMFKFSLPIEINYNYQKASAQDVIIPLLDTACSFIAGQLGEEKPYEPIILKPERLTLRAFASFIDIKGVIKGKFILSIGEEIGRKFIEAFRIAHLNDAEVDDMIEDALAETANIIIGNSIAKFPGIENSIIISTPITIYSREAVVAFSESQIWSSTLSFEHGDVLFAVVVNDLP